jgi:hypothetical protein
MRLQLTAQPHPKHAIEQRMLAMSRTLLTLAVALVVAALYVLVVGAEPVLATILAVAAIAAVATARHRRTA